MNGPDIQYFAQSGTWHKPAGAVRVDALIKAGDGGGTDGSPGQPGSFHTWSRPASELGDTIDVEIGKGGRAGTGGNGGVGGGASYAISRNTNGSGIVVNPDSRGGRGGGSAYALDAVAYVGSSTFIEGTAVDGIDGADGYACIITHLEQP